MRKLYSSAALLLILFVAGCTSFQGAGASENPKAAAEPWESSPFSSSYKVMNNAAEKAALEKEKGVRILLHEGYFIFDEKGKLESRYKWVYKILDQSGIDNWSSTRVGWTPWNQTRPEIKVRVTNPDGKSYFLSRDHIIERAERSESANIYSDRMILRAPFPRVTVGSIVEEEITLTDTLPRFDTGITKTWYFEGSNPMFMNRVVIEVPENLPFKYQVYKKEDLKPVKDSIGSSTHYTFEYSPVPAAENLEPGIPVDEPHWASLSFSTGESWNKVARVYNNLVEEKLKDTDFSSYLGKVKTPDDPFMAAVEITQWLNHQIRYTGLELGENSIVPTPPLKTLERGFGDCKDKAVIVTGMMRALGFDSHVALLSAGTSGDIDPELPGLGGFNHAIVYVGGEKPFWIDPTSEFSYKGYLPLGDQGRWSLVISPDTKDVVKTSIALSKDNKTVRDITYSMKDSGYMDVTEETTYYGSEDSYHRSLYLYSKKEDLEKSFDDYIKSAYRFGERVSLTNSDPDDFTLPFHVSARIKGAGRGLTEEVSGSVAIMQGEILNRLPDVFTFDDPDEKDRQNAYSFYQPFVYEKDYTIVPPAGFVPRKVPESEFIKLGTISLTKKFAVEDNTVKVTLILDTGKKVISKEEFAETKKAVLDFLKKKPLIINFEHIGYKLLSEGDYRGAVEEFRKYCELEKDKAVHWIRFSGALLQAGLGDDARKAALKAVELDPKSAQGWAKLAWVYQHDGLGRRLMPGYDRMGAIEAYKKAIELDPDEWLYHANLAILLEYDENGLRYSQGSNLDDAIEQYKAVGDKLAEKGMQLNLISDYFYNGQFTELLSFLDKVKNAETASLYRLVSYAALGELDKAFLEGDKSSTAGMRRKLFSDAGDILIRIRRYKEAAALLKEAAKGSDEALSLETRAATFEKTVPVEKISFDRGKPEDVVRRFLSELYLSEGKNFNGIKELVTDQVFREGTDPDNKRGLVTEWSSIRRQSVSSGISVKTFLDLLLADMKFITESDPDGGYHLKLTQSGLGKNLDSNYYLVRKGDTFLIAGMDSYSTAIGNRIQEYLDKRRYDTAKKWLNWFVEDYSIYNRTGDEPLYGRPVQRFWKKHGVKTPEVMKYAVAAIHVMNKDTAPAGLKVLEEGVKRKIRGITETSFNYALYYGYQTLDMLERMYSLSKQLYLDNPESDFAWSSYLDSLVLTGRGTELKEAAAKRLEEDPADSVTINMLMNYYFSMLDFDKVDEIFNEQVQKNRGTAYLYNSVAWMDLFKPSHDPKGLEYARTAVNLSESRSMAILHTLASQYAEAGRCKEARNTLDEVIRLSGVDEPSSDDWYVLGRIAEEYGMTDSARRYYQRVDKPEIESEKYNSAYVLAQRRLSLLRK